mmetsp:Transcript_4914/g.12480  ORF Transcript_4914/g.12480 Transcript_4914/m.12480 type:complete len:656 (+) Transcript_4914:136-2103(+)
MMKIGRIRFNPGNNKNKNNGASAGTTTNNTNNNNSNVAHNNIASNKDNTNSLDLLVDNQRQQQEYDEIDGDCFSVFSMTEDGEEDNLPISGTGELSIEANSKSKATSSLTASSAMTMDDASSTTKLVSNKKSSSSSSSSSKSPTASRRKDIEERRSKSPSSSRRSRTNRSKSPVSSRRSRTNRSKSPNSSRRQFKNRKNTTGRDDSSQQQRHKFVQLGLSSGRDHEMVIGWVRNDPEEMEENTKTMNKHHPKTPLPPPLPPSPSPSPSRSPSSKPSTPTFSSSKTRRRQTRSLSPGTRRSRRKGQSQMMDGNQSVTKGSNTSPRRGTSPVATRQGRGASLDKKQLRRKLKEEVLNVSSEMEISWHRNTGPLTSSAHHHNNNHSVVEKPGSTNSMKGQQYIPAHLRVYGAATVVTAGAGFKKPPLPPSTSTSSSSSPRLSSQKQADAVNSTRKLLATISGEEEICPLPAAVSEATSNSSSENESKGPQDPATGDETDDGISTLKIDRTVEPPQEESVKTESSPRRRRASKNSSTRVPASENPMSWRRENVVRTSSRCQSHSSTRKIKRIHRAPKSTTGDGTESSNKDNTKMTTRRSNEAEKNVYATLRRAEMLDADTTSAAKSENHPRKSNSLDRPVARAGRKIKFVTENNKTTTS